MSASLLKSLDAIFAHVPESCRASMAVAMQQIQQCVSDAEQLKESNTLLREELSSALEGYRIHFNNRAQRVTDLRDRVSAVLNGESCPQAFIDLTSTAILEFGCGEIADTHLKLEKVTKNFGELCLQMEAITKPILAENKKERDSKGLNSTPVLELQLEFLKAENEGIRSHRDRLLQKLDTYPHWVEIASVADVPHDDPLVLWDGCDLSVDHVDTEVEFGTSFFANGTEATHYLAGLNPPQSLSKLASN